MSGIRNLRKQGIVDEDRLDEEVVDAYARIEQLQQDLLNNLGISAPPKPKTHPDSLADIDVTAMTNNELGICHNQFVAYMVFIGNRLAEIEVMERTAGNHLKKVKAEISLKLRAAGNAESKVKDMLLVHPAFDRAYLEHEKLYNMKKIVAAYFEGYKESARALSRLVALRELEFGVQLRDDSIQQSPGRAPQTKHVQARPSGRGKFGRRG